MRFWNWTQIRERRYTALMPLYHYGSLILDTEEIWAVQFGILAVSIEGPDRRDAQLRFLSLSLSLFLSFFYILHVQYINKFATRSGERNRGSPRSISSRTRPGTPDNLYTSRKPWEQKRRYLGVHGDRYLCYRDTVVNCRIF